MKKLIGLMALWFCVGWVSAQTLNVYPATVTAPRGSYQTVTAIVNGVNNKTVTWSTDHGQLVGTNPCVVNEPCTIGLYDTTDANHTVHVTATSNANGAVTAVSTISFTTSPTPVTTWPRFLITQANLASLQGKTSGFIYDTIRNQAVSTYNTDNAIWAWSFTPTVSITQWAIASNVATFTATNSYTVGTVLFLSGFESSTFFNGQYVTVLSSGLSGSQFKVNFTHADQGTTSEIASAGGNGNPSSDQTHNQKEGDAFYFALMALVKPTDTFNWAGAAHDVGMYVFANYPSTFPSNTYNFKDTAQFWIIGDWLRGSGAVTSGGDLTIMRTFYEYAAQSVMYYGGHYPTPSNTYNSSQMFNGFTENGNPTAPGPTDLSVMRQYSGNNYALARLLILTEVGLLFNDDSDSPDIPTGIYNTCSATRYQVCGDGTAGSTRAYWEYVKGALLYDYWAHIEDPNVAWQAYQAAYSNLPTQPQCENTDGLQHPCFGDGRDGGSSEGVYYQYSMFMSRWALNILHTAGVDDPLVNGPQMSAVSSSWWDMKYVHDLEYLTGPNQEVWNTTYGAFKSMPTFTPLGYGDEFYYWRYVSDAWPDTALLTYDSYTGRTDRSNAIKWLTFNLALGGPLGTSYGCTQYCGYDNNLANGAFSGTSIFDMFISQPAGDPVGGTLPSDPRPSLPTELFDGSMNQNGLVRTSWGSSGTLFSYWFNNSLINHEYNIDGRFDLFSNGEYITKGRVEFNNYDMYMSTTPNQNTLSVLNTGGTCGGTFPASGSCSFYEFLQSGGQFPQAKAAGLVTVTHSELPTYAAAIGNTTNAYNGEPADGNFAAYNDVTGASRSIVFLKGSNQVVYYDRAAVGHAASTQSLSQVVTGTPTISGNTASWRTQSATQKAYLTSLLPAGGTITNLGLPCPSGAAPECNPSWQQQDWEVAAVLQVAPSGTPTSSQFLSVLEFGSSSLTKTTTTLVQSTAGQNFDGALVGSSIIMFMRTWPATASSTTFAASGATTVYVADLTPGTTYAVSGAGTPGSATADTAGVITFSATGSGNIVVGTGGGGTGGTLNSGPQIISGKVVIN